MINYVKEGLMQIKQANLKRYDDTYADTLFHFPVKLKLNLNNSKKIDFLRVVNYLLFKKFGRFFLSHLRDLL